MCGMYWIGSEQRALLGICYMRREAIYFAIVALLYYDYLSWETNLYKM